MFADEFVERTFFILHKMNLCQLLRYVAHAEVEEERLTSAASVEWFIKPKRNLHVPSKFN